VRRNTKNTIQKSNQDAEYSFIVKTNRIQEERMATKKAGKSQIAAATNIEDMPANDGRTKAASNTPKIKLDSSADLEDLIATKNRVDAVISSVRETMLAPSVKKSSPSFRTSKVAHFCKLDKTQMDYRVKKGDMPIGTKRKGSLRYLSLLEAQAWARVIRAQEQRPKNAEAVTITVANSKGGVAKTTSAVTLAQGLSLRGLSVLVIDLDPQGSATSLFGLLPNEEIGSEQTVLPLFLGDEIGIDYAIQKTYWNGIDLVPANLAIFQAEFALPSRQVKEKSFEFWHALNNGIDSARLNYDVIIIDTPPSISYLTVNALFAADGLIMPLQPNMLDFTASAQFWSLFNDLAYDLLSQQGKKKKFEFVDILLARVDAEDKMSPKVREWVSTAYGGMVLPMEIPKTNVTLTAAAAFGTVYDANDNNDPDDPASMHPKTYKRAFDAYDLFAEHVFQQLQAVWTRQVGEANA
jgi:chromosome partitioning protein